MAEEEMFLQNLSETESETNSSQKSVEKSVLKKDLPRKSDIGTNQSQLLFLSDLEKELKKSPKDKDTSLAQTSRKVHAEIQDPEEPTDEEVAEYDMD